ncbi:MAG: hypothetical protein ACLFMX_04050 [Halobacteriales archaeon]
MGVPPDGSSALGRFAPPAVALTVGLVVAAIATPVVGVVIGDHRAASSTLFSLAALVLGVGVIGWSAAVYVEDGSTAMQELLGLGRAWRDGGGRRAMAVLVGLAAGAMVGVAVGTSLAVRFGP